MTLEQDFLHYVIAEKTKSLTTASPMESRRLRTEIDLANSMLAQMESNAA